MTWSYTWPATGLGNVTIESRATDDSGNIEKPSDGVTVSVGCPCGLYGQDYTPSVTSENDPTPLELGVKFTSSVNGWVAGVRFYKGAGNNGTHTGSLWSATGTLLATGHVHERNRQRLADAAVRQPGADQRRIPSTWPLITIPTAITPTTRISSTRR